MGFLHSSRARGRIPASLRRAAEVRYLGHAAGAGDATLLKFELPEFGTVAEEIFQQGQLWDAGPKPEDTAIDLLAVTVSDVRRLARDSVRFDHALLHRFVGYRKLFRHGLDVIALPDAKAPRLSQIDAELSRAAESLYRETPPARRVRICGRLDLLAVSKKVMGLFLQDGTPVTAVWTAEGFVDLANFLDTEVVVEGLVEFRPSGTLLRVDADAIREAGPADRSFSRLPFPELRRDYLKEVATVRLGHKPYASIYGLIPGEESDEEFAQAVEALS
jgi:hypothetical protein